MCVNMKSILMFCGAAKGRAFVASKVGGRGGFGSVGNVDKGAQWCRIYDTKGCVAREKLAGRLV